MPARKHETDESKYTPRSAVLPTFIPVTISDIALVTPMILSKASDSFVLKDKHIDWKMYHIVIDKNVAYIVREYCERCGKVYLYPGQRKLREVVVPDIGPVYLDTGICKDCINASVYVDKYLDGDPLSETDAKKLFYTYAEAYERAWRMVIAAAPRLAITNDEWLKACTFFNGCAMCGGSIDLQAKYFPIQFNGAHTAWNVIPLCERCNQAHNMGRLGDVKKTKRYRVFSSPSAFQKTKTIRLYLLRQMESHSLYMDPLYEYRKRFFETRVLPGSD